MSKQKAKRQPTTDDFVVLLVEDQVAQEARKELEQIDGVFVVDAPDVDKAKALISHHHVDAAIVDMRLGETATAGLRVVELLREKVPGAPVVIWTKYASQGQTIAEFIGDESVIAIVDKAEEPISELAREIEAEVQKWRQRRLKIVNRQLVRDLLWKRKGRNSYELRKTRRELDRELERIYRGLFGHVRGVEGDADGGVTITFHPIEREGLSSAVTVEGEVTIGRDADGEAVPGNRCVVKVGPVTEIRQEVERYEGFVQFGVRLQQRVELLDYSYGSLLGGIAYSFAGGVFGHELVSLDKLMQRPDGEHLAIEAMERLFDAKEKNWYGVHCREVAPPGYMKSTYSTDFKESFKVLYKSLERLQRKFSRAGISVTPSPEDGDEPGIFSFDGGELTIPPRSVTGSRVVLPPRPACLVHGDMHGGNVMVELGSAKEGKALDTDQDGWMRKAELKRICLIDYRSAGPGPRAVDAVALQASIRLADANAIAAEVTGEGNRKLSKDELGKAVVRAANRVQSESLWLKKAWEASPDGRAVAGVRSDPWARASTLLTARMRQSFEEMTVEEYLAIAIPCAIRQLGYDIGPLTRVRILAWLSAMYTAAPADGAAA